MVTIETASECDWPKGDDDSHMASIKGVFNGQSKSPDWTGRLCLRLCRDETGTESLKIK